MLDRFAAARTRPTVAELSNARRWPLVFLGGAGGLGAAGVIVGAAAAHLGGGDLAKTASEFLLIHAAAETAACALALVVPRVPMVLVTAMTLILVGAALFGGDLALAGLMDWRPLPFAAPAGGLCLIAGWCLLAASAVALSRPVR